MALQPTGQLHNSVAPRIPGAEVGHSSVEIKQIEWPPTYGRGGGGGLGARQVNMNLDMFD